MKYLNDDKYDDPDFDADLSTLLTVCRIVFGVGIFYLLIAIFYLACR